MGACTPRNAQMHIGRPVYWEVHIKLVRQKSSRNKHLGNTTEASKGKLFWLLAFPTLYLCQGVKGDSPHPMDTLFILQLPSTHHSAPQVLLP